MKTKTLTCTKVFDVREPRHFTQGANYAFHYNEAELLGFDFDWYTKVLVDSNSGLKVSGTAYKFTGKEYALKDRNGDIVAYFEEVQNV